LSMILVLYHLPVYIQSTCAYGATYVFEPPMYRS
jgi:hypothetical protein